jgi:hypothetical protein
LKWFGRPAREASSDFDGSGTNHQGYLWQYGTPGGMTVFDFRTSSKREGPLSSILRP